MEPSSHHSSLQDVIQISHFWLLCSCTVNHLKAKVKYQNDTLLLISSFILITFLVDMVLIL